MDTLKEVLQHYSMWTKDNDKRRTRHNGWDQITDAYYGILPKDWPFQTRIVDPKIRTTLIEKNARLLNAKLRGRLVPRESGDEIGAVLNNALIDFQWDSANEGGSMLTKFEVSDMDARLYGSKFAYVPWYENEDGCGNELTPLDIRDSGIDPTSTHIRDAKWFQMRSWDKLEDLEEAKDPNGKPLYKNLGPVKKAIAEKALSKYPSAKRTEYQSRTLQIRGLEDRTGEDLAFPVVKKVIEFRRDKMIVFLPDYEQIILETANPYAHGRIPIAQLRYYPLADDPIGESEVESVLGIWRAIQMTVCGYLDEVVLKMRPPLKIIENAARIETIVYGPEAQWLVDRQDAVEEMNSSADTLQYFQTTYQALLSAFNVAMGDISMQTSNTNPFQSMDQPKTATEIKASTQQQNARDQKNQNDLSEFIKDIITMWVSNNKQFLFNNPKKQEYILRIVGKEKFQKLQELELDSEEVMPETMDMIKDIVTQHPQLGDGQLQQLYDAGKMPKYPIVLNPKEQDPEKIQMKPKMSVEGNIAEVTILPKDLEGTYDYIPDVKSMALGAADTLIQARQRAIDRLTTNPVVLQLLLQEGYQPLVKELLSDDFEDTGLTDAEKYFKQIQAPQGNPAMGGTPAPQQNPGIPGVPQANPGGAVPQQMAGPSAIQLPGPVPQGLLGGMGQGDGLQGNLQPLG